MGIDPEKGMVWNLAEYLAEKGSSNLRRVVANSLLRSFAWLDDSGSISSREFFAAYQEALAAGEVSEESTATNNNPNSVYSAEEALNFLRKNVAEFEEPVRSFNFLKGRKVDGKSNVCIAGATILEPTAQDGRDYRMFYKALSGREKSAFHRSLWTLARDYYRDGLVTRVAWIRTASFEELNDLNNMGPKRSSIVIAALHRPGLNT